MVLFLSYLLPSRGRGSDMDKDVEMLGQGQGQDQGQGQVLHFENSCIARGNTLGWGIVVEEEKRCGEQMGLFCFQNSPGGFSGREGKILGFHGRSSCA